MNSPEGLVNKPVEFMLTAGKAYDDIFNQAEVNVVSSNSAGRSWRVPAFWAGADTFRFRFAAPAPGEYTWRSECTHADDGGLHGQTGALKARPYDGQNLLYRHGRLRVAATRRTLEHAP